MDQIDVFRAMLKMGYTKWHMLEDIAPEAGKGYEETAAAIRAMVGMGYIEAHQNQFCVRTLKFPSKDEEAVLEAILLIGIAGNIRNTATVGMKANLPQEECAPAVGKLFDKGMVEEVKGQLQVTDKGMNVVRVARFLGNVRAQILFIVGGLFDPTAQDIMLGVDRSNHPLVQFGLETMVIHGIIKMEDDKYRLDSYGQSLLVALFKSQGIET